MFTGFRDIDSFLLDGLDGKHIVLAGFPKSGKTTFALSMALNIALDGYDIAYIKIKIYDNDKEINDIPGGSVIFIDGLKHGNNPELYFLNRDPSLVVFVYEIPVPDRLCKMPVVTDLPAELSLLADAVLFLHNRNAIIAKNDSGPVGIAALEYVEKYIFREYPEFGNCYIEKYKAFKEKGERNVN